jgi:hypothetical protein
MARKIVQMGNEQAAVRLLLVDTYFIGLTYHARGAQVPPTEGLATRFLSRYDKSATNIKDSEIFIKIGQVSLQLS